MKIFISGATDIPEFFLTGLVGKLHPSPFCQIDELVLSPEHLSPMTRLQTESKKCRQKLWLAILPLSKLDPQTFEEIQLYYQQIEANLNNEWLYRGSHFTLHHISAIFGYQPTIVDKNKIKGYLLSL